MTLLQDVVVGVLFLRDHEGGEMHDEASSNVHFYSTGVINLTPNNISAIVYDCCFAFPSPKALNGFHSNDSI